MDQARQRWTHGERRRKQPSLYDEYLSEEKQAHVTSPTTTIGSTHSASSSSNRLFTPHPRESSGNNNNNNNTIRTVTPDQNSVSSASVSISGSASALTEDPAANPAPLHASEPQLPAQYSPTLSPQSQQRQKEKVSAGAGDSPRTLIKSTTTTTTTTSTTSTTSTASTTLLGRSESTDAIKRDTLSRLGYVGSRRSRTRTLEESAPRDRSPGSGLPKHRLRHGSVVTQSHTPSHSANDSVSSIGHTQLISPLSQTSFSSASTAPPPRPRSPASTLNSRSNSMNSLPNANARRILHLMKTLCGRMSGSLQFRKSAIAPWTTSYCYIQDEVGSLMCEPDAGTDHHRTLVPDLRGCHVRAAMDDDTQIPYLDISVPNSSMELHIRLKDRSDFDSWFAALLCWQPIRPKGIQNKMTKPPSSTMASVLSLSDSRRNSEMSLTLKEAPVIKVGPMIYWDTNVSYGNISATTPRAVNRPQVARLQSYGSHWWRRASCTLRENGELKLYAESGSNLLSVVQLSHLSRCAIQRLDSSVLDHDFCIAIYPQYTSGTTISSTVRPVYLSLESRILYEVWFVLLRAFTLPQLYGPKAANANTEQEDEATTPQLLDKMIFPASPDMFRMERGLVIRIVEARLPRENVSTTAEFNHHQSIRRGQWPPSPQQQDGHYIEIHLDGETRGKTHIKHDGNSPFWREEFEYLDLPAVLTSASVVLRRRPPDLSTPREQQELRLVHEAYGLVDAGQAAGINQGFTGMTHDQTLGKVEIYLEELEGAKEVEKWWPVINSYSEHIGEVLIKARAEENVILMSKDYEPLSQLLHNFGNELTLQIAQMIPTELRRLSDILLNIFQVSETVEEWICSLVEEEIDGVHKETPASRLRYSKRVGGGDADSTAAIAASSERELLVRDMNKNATLEANLLFRGNTLLTKSLDSHMRRVGKEYLIEVLGPTIRDINEKDPDCEVDPNRVPNDRALERNWQKLLLATHDVWNAINTSSKRAPNELKMIFRHIRACAEDRYGDFLRSVTYSSVSGFLFLRFFCPAVLNPKLFGLLKEDPKPRARRTFTLIAKSLQGLANMASFGSKEHWMEPMNAFLTQHRDSFKTFIDDVCTLPVSNPAIPATQLHEKPPSYSTPIAIRNRLPLTSREGFPSLPYLIDQAREFAGLVELWLQGTRSQDGHESIADAIGNEDGDLLAFHTLCTKLNARTQDCLSRAERAERPNSTLSFRWEELIDQLHHSSGLGPASRPTSTEDLVGDVDSIAGRVGLEIDTPTGESFDNAAMRAAGEAAIRARANHGSDIYNNGPDDDSDLDDLDQDGHSFQHFEDDPDGGAASLAASILTREQSASSIQSQKNLNRSAMSHLARASFDHGTAALTTSISATSLAASGPSSSSVLEHETMTGSLRDRLERDREISRAIEAQLSVSKRGISSAGGSRNNSTITSPNTFNNPSFSSYSSTVIGNATSTAQRGSSSHGSTFSHGSGASTSLSGGVGSEADNNATTALPPWHKERERREKEREKLKKREKEEKERRLKDLVPLSGMMGGLRGRRKEKEKEKERLREAGLPSVNTGGAQREGQD